MHKMSGITFDDYGLPADDPKSDPMLKLKQVWYKIMNVLD